MRLVRCQEYTATEGGASEQRIEAERQRRSISRRGSRRDEPPRTQAVTASAGWVIGVPRPASVPDLV